MTGAIGGPVDAPRDAAWRESRRTAVEVNAVKLLLLAALAPLVVAGLAQRSTQLVGGSDPEAAGEIVALAVAVGALCAVAGALGLGALADIGTRAGKWGWVLVGAVIGTAGLVLATAPTVPALVTGWGIAQLGYSGGMAVLRSILAETRSSHLRRGSVVMVMSGYIGAFVPILLLIVFPGAVWVVTFVFAAACIAAPLAVIAARERRTRGGAPDAGGAKRDPEPGPPASAAAHSQTRSRPRGQRLRFGVVLLVQCASSVVLAAFLTFHPLDLELRLALGEAETVRASATVLGVALVGLLAAASVLMARPGILSRGRDVLLAAAVLLSFSILLRAVSDSLWQVAVASLCSGIALSLNSGALLVNALETAAGARTGRLIGAYSACGALGQFLGPLGGLALFTGLQDFGAGYSAAFSAIACLPLLWGALLLFPRSRRTADAAPETATFR